MPMSVYADVLPVLSVKEFVGDEVRELGRLAYPSVEVAKGVLAAMPEGQPLVVDLVTSDGMIVVDKPVSYETATILIGGKALE